MHPRSNPMSQVWWTAVSIVCLTCGLMMSSQCVDPVWTGSNNCRPSLTGPCFCLRSWSIRLKSRRLSFTRQAEAVTLMENIAFPLDMTHVRSGGREKENVPGCCLPPVAIGIAASLCRSTANNPADDWYDVMDILQSKLRLWNSALLNRVRNRTASYRSDLRSESQIEEGEFL